MTLRQKTLATIIITLIGLLALLYIGYSQIVLQSFDALEQTHVRDHVEQVTGFLTSQVRNLGLQIKDWAHWDQTYRFMHGEHADYIDDNLAGDTFDHLRLNLMLFVDTNGQIIYGKAYDLVSQQELPLSPDLQTHLDANPMLLARPVNPTSGVSGLLVINNTALMVATSPILPNNGAGTSAGTLIWARYLTEQVVNQLSELIQAPVSLVRFNSASLPDDFADLALTITNPVATRVLSETEVAGYGLLTNLYGQPAVILQLVLPRDIYAHGQLSMSWFAWSLAGAGIISGVVFLVLLEKLILSRLAHISRTVESISTSRDFSARVPTNGNDELTRLADAINTSLAATADTQSKLRALNEDLERRVAERTADLEYEILFQEAILNSMHEGVLYGTEHEIEYANHMMQELTGYELSELIGQPQSMLFSAPAPLERHRTLGGDDHAEGWIQRGERKLRRKDGKLVDVAFTVAPLLGDPAGPKQIAIVRDVTEEKVLQARRDRFLANASHELRTPLTNLITRLYLLRRQPDQFQAHLDVLDKVAAHMKSLIEDLLDVSRFNRGTLSLRRERLKLAPLIHEVVDVQRREAERKNLRLTVDLQDEDITVFVDRKRMVQVLTNLIFNAINYTPNGGSVEVQLRAEETAKGTMALLCVCDTGVGIEIENIDQIFQPFFRASQEVPGTGLGLSIVQEIIMQHGGDITVESSIGEGSKFTVRLLTVTPEPETTTS